MAAWYSGSLRMSSISSLVFASHAFLSIVHSSQTSQFVFWCMSILGTGVPGGGKFSLGTASSAPAPGRFLLPGILFLMYLPSSSVKSLSSSTP